MIISDEDIMKDFMDQEAPVEAPAQPAAETPENLNPNEDQLVDSSKQDIPTETADSKADVSEEGKSKAKPEEPSEDELDWESFVDTADSPEVAKPQINFEDLSKSIGFEAKSQDEFVSKVKDIQQELQQLKAAKDDSGLPDDLKAAIEVAKQGGDYLAFLDITAVDYKNVDPIDLFEDEAAELFYNADGSFREDEYYDYIDSIKDVDKALRGKQIQREMLALQAQKKDQMNQKLFVQKQEEIRQIKSTLDKLESIGGHPVKDTIKKQIFDSFASGKYQDELFKGADGKYDWNKAIENYFKAKYFDAVQKYHEHKIKSSVKRDIHKELSNSTVERPTNPENPTNTKQPTGVDLYIQEYLKV